MDTNTTSPTVSGQVRAHVNDWCVPAPKSLINARSGLSASNLRLLLLLDSFAGQRPLCWPANRRLAHELDRTERTIRAQLEELEADGWISRVLLEGDDRQRPGIIMRRRCRPSDRSPAADTPEKVDQAARDLMAGWKRAYGLEGQDPPYTVRMASDKRQCTSAPPRKKTARPPGRKSPHNVSVPPHPRSYHPDARGAKPGKTEKTEDLKAATNVNGPDTPLPQPWFPPTPTGPLAKVLPTVPGFSFVARPDLPPSPRVVVPSPKPPIGPVEASRDREGAEDPPAADRPAWRPARASQTPEQQLEHEVAELIKLLDDPVARDHALRHLQRLGRLPADPIDDQVEAKVEAIVSPLVVAPELGPIPVPEPPPSIAEPVTPPHLDVCPAMSSYDQHMATARAREALELSAFQTKAEALEQYRARINATLNDPTSPFPGDRRLLEHLMGLGRDCGPAAVDLAAQGLARSFRDGKSQAGFAALVWSVASGHSGPLLVAAAYFEAWMARNGKGSPLGAIFFATARRLGWTKARRGGPRRC